MRSLGEKLLHTFIVGGMWFFLAGLWVIALPYTPLLLMTAGLSLALVPASILSLVIVWRDK